MTRFKYASTISPIPISLSTTNYLPYWRTLLQSMLIVRFEELDSVLNNPLRGGEEQFSHCRRGYRNGIKTREVCSGTEVREQTQRLTKGLLLVVLNHVLDSPPRGRRGKKVQLLPSLLFLRDGNIEVNRQTSEWLELRYAKRNQRTLSLVGSDFCCELGREDLLMSMTRASSDVPSTHSNLLLSATLSHFSNKVLPSHKGLEQEVELKSKHDIQWNKLSSRESIKHKPLDLREYLNASKHPHSML
jgi:hypothetical protein